MGRHGPSEPSLAVRYMRAVLIVQVSFQKNMVSFEYETALYKPTHIYTNVN